MSTSGEVLLVLAAVVVLALLLLWVVTRVGGAMTAERARAVAAQERFTGGLRHHPGAGAVVEVVRDPVGAFPADRSASGGVAVAPVVDVPDRQAQVRAEVEAALGQALAYAQRALEQVRADAPGGSEGAVRVRQAVVDGERSLVRARRRLDHLHALTVDTSYARD